MTKFVSCREGRDIQLLSRGLPEREDIPIESIGNPSTATSKFAIFLKESLAKLLGISNDMTSSLTNSRLNRL